MGEPSADVGFDERVRDLLEQPDAPLLGDDLDGEEAPATLEGTEPASDEELRRLTGITLADSPMFDLPEPVEDESGEPDAVAGQTPELDAATHHAWAEPTDDVHDTDQPPVDAATAAQSWAEAWRDDPAWKAPEVPVMAPPKFAWQDDSAAVDEGVNGFAFAAVDTDAASHVDATPAGDPFVVDLPGEGADGEIEPHDGVDPVGAEQVGAEQVGAEQVGAEHVAPVAVFAVGDAGAPPDDPFAVADVGTPAPVVDEPTWQQPSEPASYQPYEPGEPTWYEPSQPTSYDPAASASAYAATEAVPVIDDAAEPRATNGAVSVDDFRSSRPNDRLSTVKNQWSKGLSSNVLPGQSLMWADVIDKPAAPVVDKKRDRRNPLLVVISAAAALVIVVAVGLSAATHSIGPSVKTQSSTAAPHAESTIPASTPPVSDTVPCPPPTTAAPAPSDVPTTIDPAAPPAAPAAADPSAPRVKLVSMDKKPTTTAGPPTTAPPITAAPTTAAPKPTTAPRPTVAPTIAPAPTVAPAPITTAAPAPGVAPPPSDTVPGEAPPVPGADPAAGAPPACS